MMAKQSRWNDEILLVALSAWLGITSVVCIYGGYLAMEMGRFLSQTHIDIGRGIIIFGHITLIALVVLIVRLAIIQIQKAMKEYKVDTR